MQPPATQVSGIDPVDLAVSELRSQLAVILPAYPTGEAPVTRLHSFRYAIGQALRAFGAGAPPLHHRQLHALLFAVPETRQVITASGSWATDASGIQIASVPADFFRRALPGHFC